MDTIKSNQYVIDSKLYNSRDINYQFNSSSYLTYEVMRCFRGVLVFLDDHIERMEKGIEMLKLGPQFSQDLAIKNLKYLAITNIDYEGNVKLLCGLEKQRLTFACFGIPSVYPDPSLYQGGIFLSTLLAERPDPLIKQVRIAESISGEIANSRNMHVYESLLVNKEEHVTEGSKSNFFLIRNNCLFSAPHEDILHGITRKYVLHIASDLGIDVIHKNISLNELNHYEAAFICGTSPKILPVRKIDQVNYDPEHPVLKVLMKSYDSLLEAHLNDR